MTRPTALFCWGKQGVAAFCAALAGLGSASGCGAIAQPGGQAPQTISVPNRPTQTIAPEDSGLADGQSALLVERRADYSLQTLWLESEHGRPVERARRAELVVATPGGLVALRAEPVTVRVCTSCDCAEGQCKSELSGAELALPIVVRLRDGERTRLAQRPQGLLGSCGHNVMSYWITTHPTSVVETYLFFELSDAAQFCGAAHPAFASAPLAFDFGTGQPVTISPPAPTPGLLRRVQSRLREEHGDCMFDDDDEQPRWYRTTLAYDPEGRARARHGYVIGAPYACGTGPGHYSVLSEIVASAWPPNLRRLKPLPDWLKPRLRRASPNRAEQVREANLVGVSLVPEELNLADTLARFREAPLPEGPPAPSPASVRASRPGVALALPRSTSGDT